MSLAHRMGEGRGEGARVQIAVETEAAHATLNSQLSTIFAQATLAPPGAPTPTMSTLDQVEPRTPISSVPGNSPRRLARRAADFSL